MNDEIIYSSWFVDSEPFIDELKKGKYKLINENGIKKILDYITNIEQENERLLKIKKYAEAVGDKRNELYERIEKAVEYIEKHSNSFSVLDTISNGTLLNILNGKSDE